jgi:hypothetical protein
MADKIIMAKNILLVQFRNVVPNWETKDHAFTSLTQIIIYKVITKDNVKDVELTDEVRAAIDKLWNEANAKIGEQE